MIMRFSRTNWERFFSHNKTTTIRTKPKLRGHYVAVTGSYYAPEKLGEFDLIGCEEKMFSDLDEIDARNDGFGNVKELKTELMKLNGLEMDIGKVWICELKNIEKHNDRKL